MEKYQFQTKKRSANYEIRALIPLIALQKIVMAGMKPCMQGQTRRSARIRSSKLACFLLGIMHGPFFSTLISLVPIKTES
jgi:hypothetical protein